MTTQEANIKDNQTYTTDKHANIYFPHLKQYLHAVLSGNPEVFFDFVANDPDISKLTNAYDSAVTDNNDGAHAMVSVKYQTDGLAFFLVVKDAEKKNENGRPVLNEHFYLLLKWEEDRVLLLALCDALNELTLQCLRTIPDLYLNQKVFRNVNNIDMNPIYDQVAFVYALHLKMNNLSKILRCYVQILMLTRRTTYVSMCHALKYATTMPDKVEKFYTDVSIIKEKNDIYRDEEGQIVETGTKHYVVTLLNYVGQKFSQKLQLSGNVRSEIADNDRFISIVADESVMK
nr:ORF1 [Bloomfield virus]